MENSFNDLIDLYDHLVPSKKDGLIVLWLARQIHNGEIDKGFSFRDVDRAIDTIFDMSYLSQRANREATIRRLLYYYLEYLPNGSSELTLTEYAKKFVGLVEDKLNYPRLHFPLKESFEVYSQLEIESITHILDLQSWFKQGFEVSTQQTVIDHLEALKDETRSSIQKLNAILVSEENALDKAFQFSEVFSNLGKRAKEMGETLKLGNDLTRKLDIIVNRFNKITDDYKHPTNDKEREEHKQLSQDARQSEHIKDEVKNFFSRIDEKLAQIRESITFASTKLNDLQKDFQYQTSFKRNFRKFASFILEESHHSRGNVVLPEILRGRIIGIKRLKFHTLKYYSDFQIRRNPIIPQIIDHTYAKDQQNELELDLWRQEEEVKLVTEGKNMLHTHKRLDLTRYFYQILQEKNDSEIALQVLYELIQYSTNSPDYQTNINRNIVDNPQDQPILMYTILIAELA